MTTDIRSRGGNPPSGFPPLDPRLRRGKSLKASASPPLSAIREKALEPGARSTPKPHPQRDAQPIVTRAELAPCTCPEHCERDHERD